MENNKRNIPFSPPDITELEINEVAEALRSGWITTGPRTKKLENELAGFCKTNKAVCLNSATASEELNLRVLGIGEGDEVIVPAYTYTATAAAVIHVGAKPVFVDSQIDNVEMDNEKILQAVNEKTKAIIGVDVGGIICDYDSIFEIAENKKSIFKPNNEIQEAIGRIAVLADCAHSLGAVRNSKPAGSIADFSDFSFHAVKNFTTAEGGASTWRSINGIDDEKLYKKYQLLSLHGQSKDALAKTQLGSWEYDIVAPYYKCNMTDIMAAIGLVQLQRYPSLLERRKEIILKYDAACDEIGVKHLNHYTEKSTSSGHLYLSRVFRKDGTPVDDETRRKIIIEMAEQGIATNVHYKPLPMMSAYKNLGWDIADFPNAYNYYQNLISLPLHTKLSDDDVDYISENYKKIVLKYI
jgi:dTDP-4-amino-4,6-dideoxygalactose transaminase